MSLDQRTEPELICWLDLETTGLNEKTDKVLEIACVVTDFDFNEVARRQEVIAPDGAWLDLMVPEVLCAHYESYLIAEVFAVLTDWNGSHDRNAVDALIGEWLRDVSPDKPLALAGSGVAHFDRRFLKEHLPYVERKLTYWTIDIGVLRRVLTRLAGWEFDRMPIAHRAMPDVEQSIEEARRLVRMIAPQRTNSGWIGV